MSEQQLILFESHSLSGHRGDDKHWYLRGVFGKADHIGENKRLYPREVLEAAVSKYIRDKVLPGAAYGTLDHEQTPNVSLKESAIRITRLWWEGSDLMGEALVLNTEQGKNLQAMLEAGGTVGLSTRGTGRQDKHGTISEYRIASVDVVSQPANTASQFVSAVYEDEEFQEGLPINNTDNAAGLDDNPPVKKRRSKMVRHALYKTTQAFRNAIAKINGGNAESVVYINLPYKNPDPTAAQQTTKRKQMGIKEDMPLTTGKRYLSPDSSTPKSGKPKHLKPKNSKKGMLESTDADMLYESLGGVLKAVAGAVAGNQLTRHSSVYRSAKVAFKGYKAYQKGKPQTMKNTNLPKSPTQVLSKGTTNMPRSSLKRESVLRTPEVEAREALLMAWQSQNKDGRRTQMIANMIDGQEKLKGEF